MTGDQVFILLVVLAIALFLLYLAAGLIVVFTAFVLSLSPILSILMFILFPPTLIVFLVGLAFIALGFGESNDATPSGRRSSGDKYLDAERERRRSLGYDD